MFYIYLFSTSFDLRSLSGVKRLFKIFTTKDTT